MANHQYKDTEKLELKNQKKNTMQELTKSVQLSIFI